MIGGLFVLETVSVMVQVVSFKLTGKRVFAMAPLHHHFEQKGWREPTIVIRFWIIAVRPGADRPVDPEAEVRAACSRRAHSRAERVALFGLARSGTRLRRRPGGGRRRGGRLGRWRRCASPRRLPPASRSAILPPLDFGSSSALVLVAGIPLTHPQPALDRRQGAGRRHRDDRRHRGLQPRDCRDRRAPGGHHRHQWQVDDHRAHRPCAARGRARCRCRRQYRHGGVPAAAARARTGSTSSNCPPFRSTSRPGSSPMRRC